MISKQDTKTILVVEDEKPLLEAIRITLEKDDFKVITARSAKDAYSLLESPEKIDVIWLDHYLLGKENGLDLVIKLKSQKQYKNIPVFIVSNTASADKVKSYIRLGVNKYYTKANYRLDSIIGDIRDYLKTK